jgi:TonB-dependent receptor
VVPLDVFPASLLESIVVSKSATPDRPGDFAGGSVEIRTKEFPENRILQISTSIGYNSRTTLKDGQYPKWGFGDYLGFNRTRRQPSFPLTDNVAIAERSWEAIRHDWNPTAESAMPNMGLGLNVGGQAGERTPLGYVFSLTYSLNDEHTPDRIYRIYTDPRGSALKGLRYDDARRTVDWGSIANFTLKLGGSNKIGWKNLYSRNAEELYSVSEGTNSDRNGAVKQYQSLYVERDLLQTQLTGDHFMRVLASSRLEWKGTFSLAQRDEPDNRQAIYIRGPGVVDYQFGDNADVWYRKLDDTQYNAQADWMTPFGFGWIRGSSLKFGGAYRDKTREFKSLLVSYVVNKLQPIDNDILRLPPERLFSPELVGSALVIQIPGQISQPYSADESIAAYYGMVDIPFMSRLRIVGGARMEKWSLDLYDGGRRLYDPKNPETAPLQRRNDDLLWSANATFEITDRMNFRLAAFRSVVRPDTRELTRDTYADFVGSCPTQGNPSLQRTAIINGDARWEWYPNPGEIVALSAFYKDFDSPILRSVNSQNNCQYSFENAISAKNYGGEIDVRRGLTFLPGELSRLVGGVNFTYVKSSLLMDPRLGLYDKGTTLEDQSPYLINASLAYAHPRSGFMATVLFNHFDDRIVRYGIRAPGSNGLGQGPNIVEQGRSTLDLKVQYSVASGVQLSISGKNLTNSTSLLTQATADGLAPVGRTNPGTSVSIGLSYAR